MASDDYVKDGEKVTDIEEARKIIKQLQGKLRAQSHQFLSWHRKFRIQEETIRNLVLDRNEQLKIVTAKLILFEAKLHKKQKDINSLLLQRECVIKKQQQTIEKLQNRLLNAGIDNDKYIDCDNDSAVIMEDEELHYLPYIRSQSAESVTYIPSDLQEQPHNNKSLRRANALLRRPDILETVYSVEEDTEMDIETLKQTSRLDHLHSSTEMLDQDRSDRSNHTTTFNRVMSNHRSVTKPKDVKYRRINKAKSKSLEELRGRLKNWVEKGSRFNFSFDHSFR